MNTWHVGKKTELTETDGKFLSEYYVGDEHGFYRNTVDILTDSDGGISLTDSSYGDNIYLYPEQVEHLKQILKLTNKE
jgi:hypothetical protein